MQAKDINYMVPTTYKITKKRNQINHMEDNILNGTQELGNKICQGIIGIDETLTFSNNLQFTTFRFQGASAILSGEK
jgi:hypothetical protein